MCVCEMAAAQIHYSIQNAQKTANPFIVCCRREGRLFHLSICPLPPRVTHSMVALPLPLLSSFHFGRFSLNSNSILPNHRNHRFGAVGFGVFCVCAYAHTSADPYIYIWLCGCVAMRCCGGDTKIAFNLIANNGRLHIPAEH